MPAASLPPIPTLETPRLVLRAHRLSDFDDCAAMWRDPAVVKHIGGRPFSAEESWSRILRYVGHWALLGFGYWIAHDKESGKMVGEVGFADFHRDLEPSFDGAPEMGWVLAPHAHGRGLATEAAQAALAYADERIDAPATVCMIDPDNAASIRVAEKCGYRETTRTTYKGNPAVLFARARSRPTR